MFVHPKIATTVNGAIIWNPDERAIFPKSAKKLPEQPRGGVLRYSTTTPAPKAAVKAMRKVAAASKAAA